MTIGSRLPISTPAQWSDVVVDVRQSVVRIFTQTCDGSNYTGSGFATNSGILTNAHVVEGAAIVTAIDDSGNELRAHVKRIDAYNDLALLELDGRKLPSVEWSQAAARVGDEVALLGFPRGMGLTFSRGSVSSVNADFTFLGGQSSSGLIQTDASINPGNSGGPLIDRFGRVVGVAVSKFLDSEGIGFAIDGRAARLFADGYKGESPPICSDEQSSEVVASLPTSPSTSVLQKPEPDSPINLEIVSHDPFSPSCDGSFIVVHNSITKPPYSDNVAAALDSVADSSYFRAAGTCSSLRWFLEDGSNVYVVFTGPFGTLSEACENLGGEAAYVRQLTNDSTVARLNCGGPRESTANTPQA
jgi:Trypsin-like peptidase domain